MFVVEADRRAVCANVPADDETVGRQSPIRTGLTKVGLPGAELGLQPEDATIADVLKTQGYVTAQFGKNHLGDRDQHLPTVHGFDEFFGNLYHLNAEQEPENPDRCWVCDIP
jgi:arylsulfatase A-like enzyme